MPSSFRSFSLFIVFVCVLYNCAQQTEIINKYEAAVIRVNPETARIEASAIRSGANVTLAEGLELSLWAADSLVQDPIAISVAPDGRIFYTQASRQTSSEFDIRGHQNWMTASLSFATVEDRREFLRQTFSVNSEESEMHLKDLNADGVRDWRDLTVEKENVWFVADSTGDGVADMSQRYLVDFGQEITDVANGVEFHNGEVFIAVGPDLWRTKDDNQDGIADATESLSHGYAVHIGFSGHGMSGVTVGPQGRIWWGIGDIGMNVIDKSGKHWKYPNRGVVVRSEPDGSNFEVFAMGVRNTHEFAFDKYGNLITVDNDGDHAGERERLTYLIDGSDTGWRINWQFGKYTDPKNNTYKVWMDEKMYLPPTEEQAAYFLPPIQNFINGPTGLVYNPGTALSPDYYDHFFVAEFRGSPNNSPIHAFKMKPNGAGFALDSSHIIVQGLLPTGLDFGAEGALYFGDWINGWGTKDEGRIWKLDKPKGAEMALRASTKALLTKGFSDLSKDELIELLGHQDQRVRKKAQFFLVENVSRAFKYFSAVALDSSAKQLARIHSIWGMAQLLRAGRGKEEVLMTLLADNDAEIIAQAAKIIGDVKVAVDPSALISLLNHQAPRVRFFAMEALGRLKAQKAISPIIEMLRTSGDQDLWIRHGGMVALGRIGDEGAMELLAQDPSRTIRLVAIVALRRMESARVKAFLTDADEYVVAEAARAITDDYTIPGAMPALAEILNTRAWTNEALIRRIINANLNIDSSRTVDNLITYARHPDHPAAMRAEALATLANWEDPSLFDRVDGRYRGPRQRSATYVREQLGQELPILLASEISQVQRAAIEAAAGLGISSVSDQVIALLNGARDPNTRATALIALDKMQVPDLALLLRQSMNDRNNIVRSQALALLPQSSVAPEKAVDLYAEIIDRGSISEAQAAIAGLGEITIPKAENLLLDLLDRMQKRRLRSPLHLDLIETLETKTENTQIFEKLAAYEAQLLTKDELGFFAAALEGGNPDNGRGIFYWNSTAQCTRCHAIFEYGGNVGPNLSGVGYRLSARELLASVIRPSAALAIGHETVLVSLIDETTVSGIVMERTPSFLKLKVGKTETHSIPRADIVEERTFPSSMPSVEGKLSRREIRDLVAFLAQEKGAAI